MEQTDNTKTFENALAENARLQADNRRHLQRIAALEAQLKAAQEQEPVGTVSRVWRDSLMIDRNQNAAPLEEVGVKLYAAPVPAQQSPSVLFYGSHGHAGYVVDERQSPAVAVPDFDWLSLQLKSACSWGKTYSELRPADWDECMKKYVSNVIADKPESPRITEQDDNLAVLVSQELYSNGGAHESQIDVARRIIGFIASRLPQRVTEQDAIEILKGFSKWEDFAGMVPTPEGFCKSKEGRALLDKLNGVKSE